MAEELTHAEFAAVVGDAFRIDFGEAGTVDLKLTEATLGGAEGAERPFTLRFRGPKEPLLAQATYRLEHSGMGTLDIFIVPTDADADGVGYEAIFA